MDSKFDKQGKMCYYFVIRKKGATGNGLAFMICYKK